MSDNDRHEGDVDFIRSLAELLRANDLTELQVKRDYGENDSLNVRVSRHMQVAPPPAAAAAPPAPAAAPMTTAQPGPSAAAQSAEDDVSNHPGVVSSPMVGTAYMQGEPGAAPFVSVGAQVKEGDTVLIIEAMKTMNNIPAPRSGKVTRILVEDGSPVEYGAPLMIIE
ncbi:acetyl-CoA carboxylase biotin carboxyl carrier protein [Pseudoroseicyclus sp. H15]